MAASKTTDAVKLVVRLPKPLHRRLKQEARRRDVSLNTLIVSRMEGRDVQAAEQIETTIKQASDVTEIDCTIERTYRPLGDLGLSLAPLWSPEYERIRREGGHPELPPNVERALRRAARRAKVSPEEFFKARLRELGHDPDAPYQPPVELSEPDETPGKQVA